MTAFPAHIRMTAFGLRCVREQAAYNLHGGARLTPLGTEVLARYRAIERHAVEAVSAELGGFAALVRVPVSPSPAAGDAARSRHLPPRP